MGACLGGSKSADDQLWAYVAPGDKYGPAPELEILNTLLATGKIDVNSRRHGGDTAMHWVCREQAPPSVPTIDWLSKYKPNLELMNDAEKTVLHCAAGGRAPENVSKLIAIGANVNAAGAFKSTPLMYACALGLHANIDALMRDAACDVAAVNANGDTALNRLSRLGARERNSPDDLRIAEAMVARGADINKPNSEGFTPLLSATVAGKANLMVYFIRLGASLTVQNAYKEGLTVLATREHVKFVLSAFAAFRELVSEGALDAKFDRHLSALILEYCLLGANDK